MKKFIVILSVLVLLVLSCVLVSCGGSDRNQEIIKDIETYYKMVDGVEKLHIKVTYFDGSTEERTVDVPKRIVSMQLSETTFIQSETVPELKIDILYDDETTDEIVVTEEMVVAGAADFNKEGTYTLEILYRGRSITETITVLKAEGVFAYTAGVLTNYSTFEEAFINADTGSTLTICDDISLESEDVVAFKIEKAITIDGRNHTISTATNKKVFEIYANTTIKNLKIVSSYTAGRCIDTRVDGVSVILENVELTCSGSGAVQPITVGGSADDNAETVVDIKIINSKITGTTSAYNIIVFVPCNLTIEGTTITGWNSLYLKQGSETSVVTITKSTLNGSSVHNDESNSFAILMTETSCKVTVTDTFVNMSNTSDAATYYLALTTDSDLTGVEMNITAVINTSGERLAHKGSHPGIVVNAVPAT